MSKISLPACSLEDLELIIVGFTKNKKEASNDDIAKTTALSGQIIGRSKGFLQELEIINGGHKKNITSDGADFGRAIEHSQSELVIKKWRDLVSSNEFLSGLITTLRLKSKMSREDFESHILYASNATNNQWNKRGAKTIVEIFEKSGLIKEENGEVVVSSDKTYSFENSVKENEPDINESDSEEKVEALPNSEENDDQRQTDTIYSRSKSPVININIQLQIPESDDPEIYNNFFKALKENLLDD